MRVGSPEEKYINDVFGLDDPELAGVRENLKRHALEFMAVSAHEGRLLQFLVRAFAVKKIVEVGTLFGYSTMCMAKALPSDGLIITLEKNEQNFDMANQAFKASSVAGKIRSLCGDAVDLLKQVAPAGPFDLVFIDANKAAYGEYLDWAEQNVRPGGLIVGDNTFLFGAVYGPSRDPKVGDKQIRVMQEFNERLANPKRYNSILIPTGEGMTVAQKL